ncbi:U3 small nucleolar RNA-associated protein 4 homolog [Anoplophora glabripennis]|nr:U3 small nucleolar RNA-associated protein 4 homolog [Anoplophora glabripennis]
MSSTKIHNVRFYTSEPRAIRCMALQPDTKKLAVSRVDASIEIWNITNLWFIEKTIAPESENFSIESLKWFNNRLFSVGLHGLLIEYDLYKLAVRNRSTVTGEAAFCLDIHSSKSQIAIGTEQGYLNIFTIEEDGVCFEKFLDKQEGRIMCLKYDTSGEFIVSGSIDAIRIWNVESGHAIHKMTTGRSEANKPTIVWCLEVTSDFTIISGDSRGKLTFWDGKIGAQLESYQSHQADILSVVLSEDENSLCCAGVDPNIINYAKVSVKGDTQKWVKSTQKHIHDHDVNALIFCNNKLYSGGADSYLAGSCHAPKTVLKMPPILQGPCVHLATEARCLMLRYSKHVEVWTLGRSENTDSNYRGLITLKEEPKKLLVLQRVIKDYDGDEEKLGVLFSCISNNGKWIIFSTSLGVRLFQLDYVEEKPSLLKVDDLENKEVPCVNATFTPSNSQFITAPNTGGLFVYDIKYDRVSISQTLESLDLSDTVTFLTVSACGKYLVAADPCSNIVVWVRKNEKWNSHCKLPKYQYPPTAMAIHPNTACLVVAYSDNSIVEYDIKKRAFSTFSRRLQKFFFTQWKLRTYPFRNITFDPRVDNIVILHDDGNIIIIDKDKEASCKNAKKPKIDKTRAIENEGDKVSDKSFRVVKKEKHLVHLQWLEDDEMVAVEVNPLSIMEQLPPAFVQNKFGRK